MNLISLFVTAVLTENIVLTKFLGLCPFLGTSDKTKTALGMGISVTIVVLLSSIVTYLIYQLVLIPTNTIYLTTIMFIFVIACFVQIISIIIKVNFPKLYNSFGIYLPLITTNCAVLGITLLNVNSDFNFIEMIVYSLGSSLGFTFIIYIFSTIRENLNDAIPSFRGYPIAFITAGIMALIFGRIV